MSKGLTYRDAGVDIDAGNELVRRIGPACKATRRPEMLNPLGGFAALTEIPAGYATFDEAGLTLEVNKVPIFTRDRGQYYTGYSFELE